METWGRVKLYRVGKLVWLGAPYLWGASGLGSVLAETTCFLPVVACGLRQWSVLAAVSLLRVWVPHGSTANDPSLCLCTCSCATQVLDNPPDYQKYYRQMNKVLAAASPS